MRRSLLVLVALLGAAAPPPLAVQVRNGDVWVRQAGAWGRLTHDGLSTEAIASRDGTLVAYVHKDSGGGAGDDAMNSISLCVVAQRACRIVVAPAASRAPEQNLTGINAAAFSLQASAAGGVPQGSIFFLASAWQTSDAIHRLRLANNGAPSFITDAEGFTVIDAGRFAGALLVTKMAGGTCTQVTFDPNTRTALTPTRPLDC